MIILTCKRDVNPGGHQPALLFDTKYGYTVAVDVRGRILGIVEDSQYPQSEFRLVPGDVLVIYTDGITDARQAGSLYRPEGLAKTVAANARNAENVIAEAMIEDATRAGGGSLGDDAAALVVKARDV